MITNDSFIIGFTNPKTQTLWVTIRWNTRIWVILAQRKKKWQQMYVRVFSKWKVLPKYELPLLLLLLLYIHRLKNMTHIFTLQNALRIVCYIRLSNYNLLSVFICNYHTYSFPSCLNHHHLSVGLLLTNSVLTGPTHSMSVLYAAARLPLCHQIWLPWYFCFKHEKLSYCMLKTEIKHLSLACTDPSLFSFSNSLHCLLASSHSPP